MFDMKPSAGRTFACTLALLASALTFLAFGAASAYATTSCAKKVLADWFDNSRIDGFYPLHCYQEAIAAVPPEIRDYSDAQDVITQAMREASGRRIAISKRKPGGEPITPLAAPPVNTAGPTSAPLPLLVLGGLALALLAAGGTGYVARRRRAGSGHNVNDDDLS